MNGLGDPSHADTNAEPSSTGERAIAAIGCWWIPVIWFLNVRSENVPTTWKWAITFWAAYGLYECTATLSAKRKAWARNLSIARFASLTLLAGASIYVLVTKW